MTHDDAGNQARAACPYPSPGSAAEEAAPTLRAFFSDFSPAKVASLLDDTLRRAGVFPRHTQTHRQPRDCASTRAQRGRSRELRGAHRRGILGNGRGDYYLRWAMRIRFRRLRQAAIRTRSACRTWRFDADGRVIFHRDFWNAAEGLFQYVPPAGPG